jgi:Pentapeptide repeats (8 copies)
LLGDRAFIDAEGLSAEAAAEVVVHRLIDSYFPALGRIKKVRRSAYVATTATISLIIIAILYSFRLSESNYRLRELVAERDPQVLAYRIKNGQTGQSVRGANVARADLSHMDLQRMNFSQAILDNVNLEGANISFAVFDDAIMTKAGLLGATARSASFTNATILGADLRRVDLRGAVLVNADLRAADLRGAILTDAKIDGVRVDGALFDRLTIWPQGFDPSKHAARCADCDQPIFR